jgi:hypothetical protein
MADDPDLERLRRLLAPTQEKQPSRLKQMLAKLAARKAKYGRRSKRNKDDKAA